MKQRQQPSAGGAPAAGGRDRECAAAALCALIAEVHGRGWCLGTSGNFSVCLSHDPLRLLITPSGHDKGQLRPRDLLTVDGEGRVVEGDGRASAETPLHVVLARDPECRCVLHTHSVAATLLSRHFLADGNLCLAGYEMLKGLEGIRTHDSEVRVPILANNQEMAWLSDQVEQLLERTGRLYGFLIAGHGLYTWGGSLAQAKRHLEVLEFLFEVTARRVGFAPPAEAP